MKYYCCTHERREITQASALNGIDFLEVLDHDAAADADRQRVLFVHFLKPAGPLALTPANLRIEGGERIRGFEVTEVAVLPGPDTNVVRVRLDRYGDFSMYTLRLVQGLNNDRSPPGVDPRLAAVTFNFKVQCPADFDCRDDSACPPAARAASEIDYLARDYPTFRRLMLDRMSATTPTWKERNAADLGVTLVEMLAYAADHLSYQQDAAATEAYLNTARRRTSVRRHARLMDYHVSDGSNARTWLHIRVAADQGPTPDGTRFLTRVPGAAGVILPDLPETYRRGTVVFEQLEGSRVLRTAHNEMRFYTWSERQCCLPRGATGATLAGEFPDLEAGDALIIEEVKGARTGNAADADIDHRAVVRLSEPPVIDEDPVTGQAVTEIRWHADDALPFPACVSSMTDDGQAVDDVSVLRGNIVLADHGRSIVDEPLGAVPESRLRYVADGSRHCAPERGTSIAARFRPVLEQQPLTQAARFRPGESARSAGRWDQQDVVPAITLHGDLAGNGSDWEARRDLLASKDSDAHFVVEIEQDGNATIRFGDGRYGRRPPPGTAFTASYRVGNGPAGNIGADALTHIAGPFADIEAVRNPLPARGGRAAESIESVRQRAPIAYRTQRRAVTTDDYAEVVNRLRGVQRAAASLRWTGSWHTVFVTIDRTRSDASAPELERLARARIDEYRMAGHDANLSEPQFVSLEIELFVCCERDYLRSDVKRELLDVLGAGIRSNGQRGLFHPDNFTFGQPVYLSPIFAAAQSVPGVASVDVRRFRRQGDVTDDRSIDDGVLHVGRLEVARLQNDPNFVEQGVLRIELGGGR